MVGKELIKFNNIVQLSISKGRTSYSLRVTPCSFTHIDRVTALISIGAVHSIYLIGSIIPMDWSLSNSLSIPSFTAKGTGRGRQNLGTLSGL